MIGRAKPRVMELAKGDSHRNLTITESIQFPKCPDNPSNFHDPYVKETGRDASGYVITGLLKAIAFPPPENPVVVWLAQRGGAATSAGTWGHKKLFQDDRKTLDTANVAVLVTIDPKENRGEKQAWIFVTGPMSSLLGCAKVDL